MEIIALKTLKIFYAKNPSAEKPLIYWHEKITKQDYKSPHDIVSQFKKADYVGNDRIVFNIAQNKFRLVVSFDYQRQIGFIKFVGTHDEYDKILAKTIEFKDLLKRK